jgi:hypothetical protein
VPLDELVLVDEAPEVVDPVEVVAPTVVGLPALPLVVVVGSNTAPGFAMSDGVLLLSFTGCGPAFVDRLGCSGFAAVSVAGLA